MKLSSALQKKDEKSLGDMLHSELFYTLWLGQNSQNPSNVFFTQRDMCDDCAPHVVFSALKGHKFGSPWIVLSACPATSNSPKVCVDYTFSVKNKKLQEETGQKEQEKQKEVRKYVVKVRRPDLYLDPKTLNDIQNSKALLNEKMTNILQKVDSILNQTEPDTNVPNMNLQTQAISSKPDLNSKNSNASIKNKNSKKSKSTKNVTDDLINSVVLDLEEFANLENPNKLEGLKKSEIGKEIANFRAIKEQNMREDLDNLKKISENTNLSNKEYFILSVEDILSNIPECLSNEKLKDLLQNRSNEVKDEEIKDDMNATVKRLAQKKNLKGIIRWIENRLTVSTNRGSQNHLKNTQNNDNDIGDDDE